MLKHPCHSYREHFKVLQDMRKGIPNDSIFAAKIRTYLYKLENQNKDD